MELAMADLISPDATTCPGDASAHVEGLHRCVPLLNGIDDAP